MIFILTTTTSLKKKKKLTTTTVELPAQGVQRTPPIKVYRNKEPKKRHQQNRQNK
jgi:hypothetical protein